ncbi:MAG: ABC transporter ATP-binding protein [Lachnospiraceae bacterium]|nr:ABC transporter ATP-binding protein [Lachnospiraceae bacterium]
MSEVIRVEHLKKYFKDVKAVDDISFSVERGELFGFLGVNGAGKSTTINMLCTLFPPTSGKVEICGYELGKQNEEIKKHIGVVYQNNCLDKLLTVKENLLLRGSLYETDKKKLLNNIKRVCEILELDGVIKRPYGKLSGGQKRRCEIATALLHTPDILFLDEPTTGLDPATRKSVWSTLKKLQKEMEMTVFLTTHYMEEAARANHIAIMDRGHLVQYGTPFTLKEQFAMDKLLIVPKEGEKVQIQQLLDKKGFTFKQKEERLSIPIPNTMSAMPLLEEISSLIEGFEVIQGTMDDVFLQITGEEK